MKFKYLTISVLTVLILGSCSYRNSENESSGQGKNSKNEAQFNRSSDFPDFTHLLDQVGPSVVSIESYYVPKSNEDNFEEIDNAQNDDEESSNSGSGIILDKDGYIITNAHVIESSNTITVVLKDRRVFLAKVVGVDELTDLALLKIQADDLIPIKVGDVQKVKVGQWIAALGAPFGFQFSLTSGIISAKKRTIQDDTSYIPFLQIDAAINQGNSGGPLLNLNGEVIGVNSQIYTRSGGFVGIAFAIPIDIVINVANQLKISGKVERGQLGVKVDAMSYELAQTFGLKNADGALVLDVLDSHDARKKLQVGDIILKLNGEEIKDPDDLPALLNLIKPGQTITLDIWRERKEASVSVVLQTQMDLNKVRKDALPINEFNNIKGKILTVEGLDVGLVKPNAAVLRYFKINNGLQIVTIGKKAESLRFALGDIIVRVGDTLIQSPTDLINALKTQKNVPVFIIRNGQPIFIPYQSMKFETNNLETP